SLSEKSIILFLVQISAIAKVKDPPLHSDTAGTFQAVVGLWQILVRQQSIPADSETHDQMVQDLMRILEAQRIVSLDTLFQLADHIESVAKGEKLDPK